MNINFQRALLVPFLYLFIPLNATDMNELEKKLITTYVREHILEHGAEDFLYRMRNGAGKIGFHTTDNTHLEAEALDQNHVKFTTTIYGQEHEFENPEKHLLTVEKRATIKGLVLSRLARVSTAETDAVSPFHLGHYTKYSPPVYYDGKRGWFKLVTYIPKNKVLELVPSLVEQDEQEQNAEDLLQRKLTLLTLTHALNINISQINKSEKS